VSWNAPACVGTGGGSISGYHLTRVGGSTVDTTLTNATSPGLPGQAGAEYLVSATSGAGTGAAAVVPASAPAITGVDLNYTGAVGVTFNTSLSNGGRQILYYVVHADPVGGAPAIEDNYYDISTHSDRLWYLIAAAGDTYDVTILPLFSDFTFGPPSAPVRVTVEDQTAPHVTTTAPTSAVTLGSTTTARWSGSDSGGAGLKSYDVRYRHAAYSGHLGKTYVYPASWQATTSTSKSLAVARGSTYCFSVRARDNNLNTSSWSVEKCTATPLDDRSLVASSHWSRTTGTAYYAHTVTSSAHRRATLTRTGVNGSHLAVLATRCAICGKVAVYADGTKVATLDLRGTTRNRLVFNVPLPHALSAATVRLKVVTRRKPVKIDGLVLRAV
jgi:hypothetical protein